MNFKSNLIILSVLSVFIFSCNTDISGPDLGVEDLPEVIIRDTWSFERDGNSTMAFEVVPFGSVTEPIGVSFEIKGITAEPGVDFEAVASAATVIGVGSSGVILELIILNDDIKEIDEKIRVTITEVSNATISDGTAIGVIRDDDEGTNIDEDGYFTSESYYGMELAWQDEFSGTSLDEAVYNYELEDGCPNLCGWGNQELQWYTNDEKNIFLEDGKLVIRATKTGVSGFNSARIQTKGKQSFHFGRIDVRAKLPEGQGIWPAIWMLGDNIDDVGWPACGEIDIMELVGHEANKAHGTAHWGPIGGPNTFKGNSFTTEDNYSEAFHVFSLVWEENELVWYMDETPFHSISPADMEGQEYRFNLPFFMVFNVAVGGLWPGNPDDTTVFPQQMEVDYVRYFKFSE